jgi:hypothetical protein
MDFVESVGGKKPTFQFRKALPLLLVCYLHNLVWLVNFVEA